MLLFLVLYLVLSFFDLYTFPAVIVAVIYTLFLIKREIKLNKIKLVEKYYPNLKEKLTTAADYANTDDIMVNELHKEVIEEVGSVATSAFVNRKGLFLKTIGCILLSFLIVSMVRVNFDSSFVKEKLEGQISKLSDKIMFMEDKNILNQSVGMGSGVGSGVNEDIFGKKYLAQLGDKNLEVEIRPTTMEFKVGEVKDAEKKDFEDVFPADVYLESAETDQEKIAEQDYELVKNYFRNIAQEG